MQRELPRREAFDLRPVHIRFAAATGTGRSKVSSAFQRHLQLNEIIAF